MGLCLGLHYDKNDDFRFDKTCMNSNCQIRDITVYAAILFSRQTSVKLQSQWENSMLNISVSIHIL